MAILSIRFDQSPWKLSSFTLQLVSSESAQLFLDKKFCPFTKFLSSATESGGPMWNAISGKSHSSTYRKLGKEFQVFWLTMVDFFVKLLSRTGLQSPIWNILETKKTIIQDRHDHSKLYQSESVPKDGINLRYYLRKKILLLNLLIWTWDAFLEVFWQWKRVDVDEKSTSQSRGCIRHCQHTLSHAIHRTGWVKQRG